MLERYRDIQKRHFSLNAPLFRFGLVGLTTNSIGYLIYLMLTAFGVSPKIAMTGLYGLGVLLGFLGNRTFSFNYQGPAIKAALRYCMAHVVGFGTNFALLLIFVDIYGFPHQLVQLIAIFIVALELFIILRLFVFPASHQNETAP